MSTCDQIGDANRVSFWRFSDDQSQISCMIGYDQEKDLFFQDTILKKADYPEYFDSIIESELLLAENAREHTVTKCFNTDYFATNDIFSLLDISFFKDFQPKGIICCERVGSVAQWQEQDEDYLRTLATLISFFFEL
ncbi:hypothetical protein LP316_14785 [Thalassotalea sp. LPB0316]|uniref:hypothetical protein n=1 Tax=Thalassotalea sp. LPB0316 TaxID=2769490 RepID=UPI0018693BA4|nr:hypothetical protein [Thalassotalea sp. LPB0316]QOL25541.1 hypothetical protein LP316_14785 [Thalassotalea sp. LPB0316]